MKTAYRIETINTRVTEWEKRLIEAAAQLAMIETSTYMRKAALTQAQADIDNDERAQRRRKTAT